MFGAFSQKNRAAGAVATAAAAGAAAAAALPADHVLHCVMVDEG